MRAYILYKTIDPIFPYSNCRVLEPLINIQASNRFRFHLQLHQCEGEDWGPAATTMPYLFFIQKIRCFNGEDLRVRWWWWWYTYIQISKLTNSM